MIKRGTTLLSFDAFEVLATDLVARPKGRKVADYDLYKVVEDGVLVPSFIIPFKRHVKETPGPAFEGTLRDYQEPLVKAVMTALGTTDGALLRVAPGAGKTTMALKVVSLLGGGRTAVLVDQLNIATQWLGAIETFLPGATAGVYSSTHKDIKKAKEDEYDIQIFVAQSLMRQEWADNPLECELLIVDEAHVFSSPAFLQSIFNVNFKRSLALTATDDRKDGLGWVFKKFLGEEVVSAKVQMMKGRVYRPKLTIDSVEISDFYQSYCGATRKMTHYDACKSCDSFIGYPKHCGGRLPIDDLSGKVVWNEDRLMWSALIQAICADEAYQAWAVKLVGKFLESNRQLLVFAQFKKPLKDLLDLCIAEYGEEPFGLYVGGAKNKDPLEKQVTFTTYAMTSKAVDMPWKDSAIFFSPASDIRQTVGRVIRIKKGKKTPVIVDPMYDNIPRLLWAHKKKKLQYQNLDFELK